MVDAEIVGYYEHGLERDRLSAGRGRVEFLRIRELLERFLPEAPAAVLDVGGGAGAYALPLAAAAGWRADLPRFLADGQYRNPGGDPASFTTSYFHRPEELTAEIADAGLEVREFVAASGSVKLLMGSTGPAYGRLGAW